MPGKNRRLLLGKPLVAYSIEHALASGVFTTVAVSSDDAQILRIAEEVGAHVLVERPAALATDEAAKLPVIKHCLRRAEAQTGLSYDTVVDLDATSPLRHPTDIARCLEAFAASAATVMLSGSRSRRSPYFNLVELRPDGLVELSKQVEGGIVRRQDAPVTYDLNGSIYVWSRASLLDAERVITDKTAVFEMPEERSLDIDSPTDWAFVEFLMRTRSGEGQASR